MRRRQDEQADSDGVTALFATLQVELIHRETFATRADARQAIFVWVYRYTDAATPRSA